MKSRIFLFSLILVVIFVAGCAQSVSEPVPEVTEIRVRGGEFWFEPDSVTVNKGDRVKIIFENAGTIVHNLEVGGYGSTEIISAGSTDTLEFIADETGTVAMWCSVEGHRAAGMEGSFVVEYESS